MLPAAARPVPRQAHRDRGVRLAQRRLQSAQRRSRSVRAGLGAAQFRHPRRRHRHGLQHRRSDRSALEILRRRRRPLLGHSERGARAEILLDRPDRERELLEARGHRPAGRHADVAADPAAGPADRDAGAAAVGGRQRRRRLGGHRVRLLGRALLRVRLGLRADARPDPAGSAGADRDGADRGDRGHRLRPQAAPADHQSRAAGARHHRRRRRLPESLDPRPRLFRAGGDAEADARCGVAARLSEFRMRRASSTTRPIRNSGSRSRITAARSANASSSSTPRRCRVSRPARCASPWTAPPPTPRSSASSMPTMSCSRTG